MTIPYVVDTSHSPHARLRPVPLNAVTFTDGFWAPRLGLNRQASLPAQHRLLEETGRLDNFRRASGQASGPFQGYYFNDSDVYKWLEAVAWALAAGPDAALEALAADVIHTLGAAQLPDGYLDTYFAGERSAERWTNLRDLHELYCAGHLFQAAVAFRRCVPGAASRELFTIALRLADHICERFGPERSPIVCGHPEVEMALVELGREAGEEKYLLQAQRFIDLRGQKLIGGSPYHLDHQPLREMDQMVGHAVRALYLCCGAADVYTESGDPALLQALERLWGCMTARQMYVTGGLGARHDGEAFGADYELPNARAYTETCAAIASVMGHWRLLQITADARYADGLEQVLYNGFLSGVSLDGLEYFYVNPLQDDGSHRRQPWFTCACCPPNVARLLASLPGYVYSLSPQGIWTHLFVQGEAEVTLLDGRRVHLRQTTRYPWEGRIVLDVRGPGEFSLFLRLPAWAREGATLSIDGQPFTGSLTPGTYLEIHHDWTEGHQLVLDVPLAVHILASHPRVLENAGRVALQRGPLLYCLEGADHPGVDLQAVEIDPVEAIRARACPDLLGGVTVLQAAGSVAAPEEAWEGQLYRPYAPETKAATALPGSLTFIPYYAWANRQAGPLQVWVRRRLS